MRSANGGIAPLLQSARLVAVVAERWSLDHFARHEATHNFCWFGDTARQTSQAHASAIVGCDWSDGSRHHGYSRGISPAVLREVHRRAASAGIGRGAGRWRRPPECIGCSRSGFDSRAATRGALGCFTDDQQRRFAFDGAGNADAHSLCATAREKAVVEDTRIVAHAVVSVESRTDFVGQMRKTWSNRSRPSRSCSNRRAEWPPSLKLVRRLNYE